jgi:hypothetical protein
VLIRSRLAQAIYWPLIAVRGGRGILPAMVLLRNLKKPPYSPAPLMDLCNGLVLGSTSLPGDMTAASSYLGLDSYLYFPDVATSILSNDAAGNFELEFSGLKWDFNVITVSLAGNNNLGDTGVAALSCSSFACASGDTYVLTYSAHNADPTNGYGELLFSMELTGSISTVPVPAAFWLLGSGLVGLMGISRCKKAP